jgi:hypothetical protein
MDTGYCCAYIICSSMKVCICHFGYKVLLRLLLTVASISIDVRKGDDNLQTFV